MLLFSTSCGGLRFVRQWSAVRSAVFRPTEVKDRVPSKELRERLRIDDIILILKQNRLRWYGHVPRKEDTDWVKKCMEYEVVGLQTKR